MTLRRSLRLGCVLCAVVGTTALAQDPAAICDRGEGVFYGAPLTLEQVYVIPGQAKPEVPSADDLFPEGHIWRRGLQLRRRWTCRRA